MKTHSNHSLDHAGDLITIVESPLGMVQRCRQGIYHVRVVNTTLHLTASQFNTTARLFKLAFGMLAGKNEQKKVQATRCP